MYQRPEIIRPPIVSPHRIELEFALGLSEDLRLDYHLPNGERLAIRGKSDEIIPVRTGGTMNSILMGEFFSDYWIGVVGRRGASDHVLKHNIRGILEGQYGLRGGDALEWSKEIIEKNPALDRLVPHWVYVSILASLQFDNYSFEKPSFITWVPSTKELKEAGIDEADLQRFRASEQPILVGTAVPLLGNYGDGAGSYNPKAEYVLLRERKGRIASGQMSFPGGKSNSLLEVTAWRELLEEVGELSMKSRPQFTKSIQKGLRRSQFLAVADQVIIDSEGNMNRFLSYVFAFWIAFPYTGGGRDYFEIEKHSSDIYGVGSDDQGDWIVAILDENKNITDAAVRGKLSPIARGVMPLLN